MNELDYAYGVAYIRSIENRLLTKNDIESLLSAKTALDAMRILFDKGYSTETITEENYERVLSFQIENAWKEVTNVCPDSELTHILLYKNDFHNLKVALKGVCTGIKDFENYFLTPSTIDKDLIVSSVLGADFKVLPEMLSDCAKEGYDILTKTGDSQLSDIIIDKACMDYTLKKAIKSKNDFLVGYVKLNNTLSDIKIAVRCAKTEKNFDFAERALSDNSYVKKDRIIKASLSGIEALIQELTEQGFTKEAETLKISMAEFEKLSDNMITEYMKSSKYTFFGIEPLINYLNTKQSEVQTVRIILSGKINGIDEMGIRSRLRDYFN